MNDHTGPGTPGQPFGIEQRIGLPKQPLNVLGAIGLAIGIVVLLIEGFRMLLFTVLWIGDYDRGLLDFYTHFTSVALWVVLILSIMALAFGLAGALKKGLPKVMAGIAIGVGVAGLPNFLWVLQRLLHPGF